MYMLLKRPAAGVLPARPGKTTLYGAEEDGRLGTKDEDGVARELAFLSEVTALAQATADALALNSTGDRARANHTGTQLAATISDFAAAASAAAPVQSVFGRGGAITAQAGDYTFAQLAAKPTTLGGYGITDAQPLDATLTGLSGVVTAADQLVYATGPDTFAVTSLSPFARTLLDDASDSVARATLGLGTAATQDVGAFDAAGSAQTAYNSILAMRGAANGLAPLGANGKLPSSFLPALAISETYVVASEAEMLAIVDENGDPPERGDVAVRTDLNRSFILRGLNPASLASWQELLTPTDAVQSVNGQTGSVNLTAANVGAQPVDATLTALAGVATAADSLIYATGVDTFATTTLSAFARTLLDDGDATIARTTLGLGTAATSNLSNMVITGGSINGTPIGGTTAAAINGTTIAATTSVAAGVTQLTQGFLRFSAVSEPNTHIRRSNNDQIVFTCNNVQNLFLTSAGVGVGLAASNAEFFHIKGDSRRAALESYGTFASLRLLSAGGTAAAPTATANAAIIGQVSAAGMRTDGSSSDWRTTGYIRWTATQGWTTTACGSRLSLSATPNNAVDPVDRLHIDQDGAILVSTGTNDGVNRVQVNGSITVATGSAYKVNNTQVVGARDTGWGALTGTTDKATAYATYAGASHGGLYSMALVQALDDAVRNLSRRHGALEAAARTHGLIN